MTRICTIIKMIPKDNIYGHVVTRNFVVTKHWHNEFEFIYLERGELTIDVASSDYVVSEGQCMVVNPMTVHSFKSVAKGSVIWVARIAMNSTMSSIEANESVADLPKKTIIIDKDAKIRQLMWQMVYANFHELNDLYASLKALEIAVEIGSNRRLVLAEIYTETLESSEMIVQMQSFIKENLHTGITLSMVADHMGFSSSYCSKYIKRQTNLNYLEYVNLIRMREVEHLLTRCDDNIADIAYRVGFTSIQSFNRIFKKYRGITPSEYRSSQRTKIRLR